MKKQKRKLGEVWKDGRLWMVQFPMGRDGYKTKKLAMKWAAVTLAADLDTMNFQGVLKK